METARWIQQARPEDLEAYNCLVLASQDMTFQYALWMLGEPEVAETVIQESFLRAFQTFRSSQEEDFRSRLLKVANRVCLEILHRGESYPHPSRKKAAGVDNDPELAGADRMLALEADTGQKDLETLLHQGLRQLSPDLRAVVILVDLLDFDYAQAAGILEISSERVRSLLARARMQVRRMWKGVP